MLGAAGRERRGAAEASRPRLDALARLVEAGAKPREAAGVVAELTGGERERALPGAHVGRLRTRTGPPVGGPS